MSGDTKPEERRALAAVLNDPRLERSAIEAAYGQVWDTEELKRDFEGHGFLAPLVAVRRKSDGKKGALTFQHAPRFYWGFEEVA